jgi:hypothetical protein
MSLSAAKTRVMMASEYLNSPRSGEIEPLLQAAEGFLAEVPDAEKEPVLAEIAQIRATLEAAPTPDETRKTSAAQGKIRQARDQIERGYNPDDIRTTLRVAEEYLAEVRATYKEAVLAEISELRAGLGAEPAPEPAAVHDSSIAPSVPLSSSTPPASAASSVPAAGDVSEADSRSMRQARMLLSTARELAGSPGRLEESELKVEQALNLLASVPDAVAVKGELLADADEVRAIAAASDKTEKIAAVRRTLDSELSLADSAKEYDQSGARKALARFRERFSASAAVLPESVQDEYHARAAALSSELDGFVKADALGRAESRMRDIEQVAASDPYAGLADDAVYRIGTDLEHYKNQLLEYLDRIPEGDADVEAMKQRLAAAEAKLGGYGARWNEHTAQDRVTSHYNGILDSIAGWEDEAIDAAPASMYSPSLPRTRDAMVRVLSMQADADVVRIRGEYPDNEIIQGAWRAAQSLFEAAAGKVSSAFARNLDLLERMPSPMREDDLQQTMHLSSAAETMLEHTRYREPVLARIEALSTRWRKDYTETLETRRQMYDQLSAEAEQKWPAIVAASGASDGFDPWNPAGVGQTVLLRQVHNRCGWEWSGREYGFAMKYQAKVLGGVWEPHVLKALEYAWYELKLEVSDRVPWDLIAVVEGAGQIGERTTRTLVDARSGNAIGQIEEWPNVDCVRLRVTGLRAGPVAVAPAS